MYSDWSFILKAWIKGPTAKQLLGEIEKALSCQLYFVLVMLLHGRPLDVVQNAGPGERAESLHCLEGLYHPRIASRFVGSF